MEITKIYFDMDGVLADFDRGLREMCSMEPVNQMTRTAEQRKMLWSRVSKVSHFYDRLEPLPDAVEFFRQIYDTYGDKVEILTGIPNSIPESADDKRSWVKRILQRDVIVHTVQRADKKNYCTDPGCILIDDLKRTIDEWNSIGGIGILHTSTQDSFTRLHSYIKENPQ